MMKTTTPKPPPKTTVPLKLLQYVNALCVCMHLHLHFNHLADAFIQSDVQMRRTIEAIRPSREQQYTSAMTSLS